MSVRKICVIGSDCSGILLSAVIALKCPEIRVSIVHKSSEFVFSMNAGQIPPELSVPGIDELIRKSHNKNLFFTTNERTQIKEAQIILITSISKLKATGEGKDQIVDLSAIEDAASLIAENADNNKIIVENSSIPFRTVECIRNILKRNGKPRVEFDVISNPALNEEGSSLRNFLNPDCVLIGCENTPKGIAAAKVLASVYERWIPSESIILMDTWPTELSKICVSAVLAQLCSALQTIAMIFEETGGDLKVFKEVVAKDKKIGSRIFDASFNVGKFPLAVRTLVYLCESYGCEELAAYWRAVLDIFSFSKVRFLKDLLWLLNGTVTDRRVVILGLTYDKNTEMLEGSWGFDLCNWLLEQKAFVNVYSSKISKKRVIEAIMCPEPHKSVEDIDKLLLMFEDPYKAAKNADIIILCSPWPEFCDLDYKMMYNNMKKPAFFFDAAGILTHSQLLKIGFRVNSYGKPKIKRI